MTCLSELVNGILKQGSSLYLIKIVRSLLWRHILNINPVRFITTLRYWFWTHRWIWRTMSKLFVCQTRETSSAIRDVSPLVGERISLVSWGFFVVLKFNGLRKLFVAGDKGRFQVILKSVELPIVPKDRCQAALRTTRLGQFFRLHDSFMCAGGEAGIDTCTVSTDKRSSWIYHEKNHVWKVNQFKRIFSWRTSTHCNHF